MNHERNLINRTSPKFKTFAFEGNKKEVAFLYLEAAQMFLPNTFYNISVDSEISKEKWFGWGEETLTALLGQLPRANLSTVAEGAAGWRPSGREWQLSRDGVKQGSRTLSPAGPRDHPGLVPSKVTVRCLQLNM